MLRNESEPAAIPALDFIALDPLDINPMISRCEIKVMYLGANRNGSYISKDTAANMSKTLRGTPIVAAWYEENQDFGDHGEVMHIENGEVTFSCATVPYGFVDPQAAVWFENFNDIDEFGNKVERTYLMTTGYLWTGQYPEITSVITEGKGQSMELNEKNLNGHWVTNDNLGYEFFIIDSASFSKLCILGDSVEPCFEGAAVTSPRAETNFSKNKAFVEALYSMREELNNALQNKGDFMPPEENEIEVTQYSETSDGSDTPSEATDTAADSEVATEPTPEAELETEATEIEELDEETEEVPGSPDVVDIVPEEEAEEEEEVEEPAPKPVDDSSDDVWKRILGLHSLDEVQNLADELAALRAENAELRAFKLETEREKKNELLQKFAMLENEEAYATIAANMDSYSLGELESKLCVLYVHTTAELTSIGAEVESQADEADPITTFNLDQAAENVGPGFLSALRRTNH